ncbi:alpha/beta hydrolase [Shimia isoporae]|nr:alpha/beta hydrolase [Shimia isoporae]
MTRTFLRLSRRSTDRPKSFALKTLQAFCLAVFVVACSPAPDLIGIDNPNVPADSVTTATRHKVFITTTRAQSEELGEFFSGARSPEVGLASVDVSIPPNHVSGELERPKRLPPDPRKEFAVVNPIVYANDSAFIRSMNEELRKRPRGNRDVLFFIHGYNNSTSDAVLRLAQFVEDTDFQGVPVLFDWASADKLTRYVYDLNSALIARAKLGEIGDVLARTNAEHYTIFAHSMGGFLTMEALMDATKTGRLNYTGRLRNIVLASPDVDMDLFRTHMEVIGNKAGDIFVLHSEDDAALSVSRKLAGGVPRVGAADSDALSALGVVAIDLSEIDDSASGSHSKFAGSPEIVQLLGYGLNQHAQFDRSHRASSITELIAGIPVTIAFE